jgi:signal transduction histidine kinase
MTTSILKWAQRRWIGWVSIGAIMSVVALSWLGYRAVTEWQRSAELVAEGSTDGAADLLFTAVTRDMRAVQASVLSGMRPLDGHSEATLDLDAVASAFARYPYPDAFFVATMGNELGPMTFYSRANRPPAWLPGTLADTPYPVVMVQQPLFGRQLLERIAPDLRQRKTLSAFEQSINGVACQIVALLTYSDRTKAHITGVLGFVVNLDWVRRNYFGEFTSQIGRIRGTDSGLRLAVVDSGGMVRAGAAARDVRAISSARRFPLLFFDPALIDLDPPADLNTEWWVAKASMSGNTSVPAARISGQVTLFIASISALMLAGGLGLSARAILARARLVDMRSDFVAAITHDLKTPTATIQAISQNFLRRTNIDDSTRRDYGEIVFQEAKRLTRLIDNILAYARISDVTEVYAFKQTSLASVVQSSLKEFRFRLETDGFDRSVIIPDDLPDVRADPAALSLAIGNLVDNAIRYSGEHRRLTIAANVVDDAVRLEVTDAGVGIPPEEIDHVTERFFRGSDTISGGSGLGLAITQRIISDHRGRLSIKSQLGVGTTVALTLPIVQDTDDTHLDC